MLYLFGEILPFDSVTGFRFWCILKVIRLQGKNQEVCQFKNLISLIIVKMHRFLRNFKTAARFGTMSPRMCSTVWKGGLVGAFFLPHGSLILTPEEPDVGALALHEGMEQSGKEIEALKPDLILLLSPHTMTTTDRMCVYMDNHAKGSAAWKDKWKGFEVDVACDGNLAYDLVKWLHASKNKYSSKVTGLKTPIDCSELHWGEVIPLWFIRNLVDINLSKKVEPSKKSVPVIVMSSRPMFLRSTQCHPAISKASQNNYYKFGESIAEWIDNNKDKKIVVIVSGDLSHRHMCTRGQEQVYSVNTNAAERFDAYAYEWMCTLDDKALNKATKLDPEAWSCGLCGMLILNGIIHWWQRTNGGKSSVQSKVIVPPTHPSYFGMTIASFQFERQ
ncbi:hypothetical protein RFI_15319 [Reticulomyxa filosa]|uniref:Extradiol ring-cleavage dioxygenase class III enzyme subunit B domain-containing protein n=1 Tax=Reticulomyxa filosa TaxID=46433 RepID=X6N7A3_RETFI|nr:hypothetical protein RFI_15319 [Reticulomyxa filosa]|eukprot:ETO21886.1 hypothetical protein RFI_15319 [Reticulomyxa filosa]